ncbi:HNH endonuclease signature motif containing protein [Gordonia sp. NB41Y]|uniref:HNH endonuclease signature motif containing protein n=1 Tax=Gordonia sp. NB41Y TaxID=875808 RepID=UPI0002BED690|nr:HNH endonuclease signature motif containing protein [Gordonia sp. NB41Y]WLP91506.1 DUF222 domain-containing protein [Gordonia sp. NB41Y]
MFFGMCSSFLTQKEAARNPGGFTQTTAAETRDTRSQAQRNHDAVKAMLNAVFADGMLGKTNRGLPIQVIVKTDLADLAAETGHAITATGTLLPIPDLIDLLPESQMYLSVFKNHTAVPLYFGQAKRIATPGQRLALFSAPDGHHCAAAGCDRQAAYMEIHHAVTDYARGGRTDIIELAALCPTHHRMVGDQPGQFSTGKIESGPDEGRTWWQQNAEPGAPPTERLINRLPDVAHNYFANLEQVRAEIHGRTPLERGGFTLNRINVFDVITPGLFTADTPHAHAFRAAMKSAGL